MVIKVISVNQVEKLVEWSSPNNLKLNVVKTKEIIVDFQKNKTPIQPSVIHDAEVEIVTSFKFLGIHISNYLKWEINTNHCVKKAHKRLFFLRRLKSFGVSRPVLIKFCRAVTETFLTLSFTVWYGSSTWDNRSQLNRRVKTAFKIIGCDLPSIESLSSS